MYLPDTNVFIALLKQEPAMQARFQALKPSSIFLSAIVESELLFGARNSTRVEENLIEVGKLRALFRAVPFDTGAAEHLAIQRAILKRAGTPIGIADLQIAATALTHNLTVVTRNAREFERVAGLKTEVW
jgi:tRNA(fMet)-specific endonuclease VapC